MRYIDRQYCQPSGGNESDGKSANLFILNASDPRHLLKTIAERRRSWSSEESDLFDPTHYPLNMYVVEENLVTLAKTILLLYIALDFDVTIRHRAELFLEVFGNAFVQSRTELYIANAGKNLVKLVYDEDAVKTNHLNSLLDLSMLKMRERDELADIFNRWRCDYEFDVEKLRDQRIRHYYGRQYDSRLNLIDWDYHSRVKEVDGVIHIKQYTEWRMSGIAYEFGQGVYNAPNRSNISTIPGIKNNPAEFGERVAVQGYWLDVVVGPYSCFGVDCDRSDPNSEYLFHVVNQGTGAEQYRHNTTEVAMYSVMSILWEIETGQPYQMTVKSDIFSGLSQNRENLERKDIISQSLGDTRIFLHTNAKVLTKSKIKSKIDVAFISQRGLVIVETNNLNAFLKPNSAILMETAKHIYPLNSISRRSKILKKLTDIASNHGWRSVDSSTSYQLEDELDNLIFQKR